MSTTQPTPEQRRRNQRAAWLLAAFALLIMASSIPFWQGLFKLAIGGG